MYFKDNPILLTTTVSTRAEFFQALGGIAPQRYPTPHNLDGLVDFLRDAQAFRIVACDWRLDDADTAAITRVLDDINVSLVR